MCQCRSENCPFVIFCVSYILSIQWSSVSEQRKVSSFSEKFETKNVYIIVFDMGHTQLQRFSFGTSFTSVSRWYLFTIPQSCQWSQKGVFHAYYFVPLLCHVTTLTPFNVKSYTTMYKYVCVCVCAWCACVCVYVSLSLSLSLPLSLSLSLYIYIYLPISLPLLPLSRFLFSN